MKNFIAKQSSQQARRSQHQGTVTGAPALWVNERTQRQREQSQAKERSGVSNDSVKLLWLCLLRLSGPAELDCKIKIWPLSLCLTLNWIIPEYSFNGEKDIIRAVTNWVSKKRVFHSFTEMFILKQQDTLDLRHFLLSWENDYKNTEPFSL